MPRCEPGQRFWIATGDRGTLGYRFPRCGWVLPTEGGPLPHPACGFQRARAGAAATQQLLACLPDAMLDRRGVAGS